MKRLFALIAAILLPITLVCACGKQPQQEPEPVPDGPEPVANVVATAQLLASEDFDALSGGIKDGSNIPSELTYSTAGSSETVSDTDLIVMAWYDLCAIKVNADSPVTDVSAGDDAISFTFNWEDGQSATFLFETTEFFSPDGNDYYRLLAPESLSEIMSALGAHLENLPAPAVVDENVVDFDGSSFSWDADNDGKPETFSVTFIDNGDEAPNVMEISLQGSDDVKATVDGAYAIKTLFSDADDNGPVLLITYEAGDYDNHDNEALCMMRLINGKLVIGALS